MIIDPLANNNQSHNDSKTHSKLNEGLVPMSLKMINESIAKETKQIDGLDFMRIRVIAQLIEE